MYTSDFRHSNNILAYIQRAISSLIHIIFTYLIFLLIYPTFNVINLLDWGFRLGDYTKILVVCNYS